MMIVARQLNGYGKLFTMSSELEPLDPQDNPFEAIKKTDESGEFWWARELREPLGYETWRRFEDAIERAIIACENSGQVAALHIASVVNLGENGLPGVDRGISDYRLTRFGAYMLAMNGDPRKTEIALAQSYFAIKTREAEIGNYPHDYPSALRAFADAVEARMIAEQRANELEDLTNVLKPKADEHDAYLDSTGLLTLHEVGQALCYAVDGEQIGLARLMSKLRKLRIMQVRGAYPYQQYVNREWFRIIQKIHRTYIGGGDKVYAQTHVTPKGFHEIFNMLKDSGEDIIETKDFDIK